VPLLVAVVAFVLLAVTWSYLSREQQQQDDLARQEAARHAEERRQELMRRGADTPPVSPQAFISADEERVAELTELATLLDQWYAERGEYPPQTGSGDALQVGPETAPCVYFASAGMTEACPSDPAAPGRMYRYVSDGLHYQLTALLDHSDDLRCEPADPGVCIFRIEDGNVVSQKRN